MRLYLNHNTIEFPADLNTMLITVLLSILLVRLFTIQLEIRYFKK